MNFLNLTSWWHSLASFEKILWGITILFSVFFVVQAVLSLAGGDSDMADGDADLSILEDDGTGHQYFTLKNLVAFFTIFGWTTIACYEGGLNTYFSLGIGFVAGSLMVVMMVLLLKSMGKLKYSGTLQMKNAIGVIAETYLTIPASREGVGKVHIKVQGALRELPALTDEANPIATGKLVKVTGLVNESILLVTTNLSDKI